jgi:hypothetical protein
MPEFKSWFWPNLYNRRLINFAIDEGFWAAIVAAVLAVLRAIFGFLLSRELEVLFFPFLDAVIFVSLAFGIRRRSRAAAVAALSFHVLGYLYVAIQHGPGGLLFAIFIAVALLNGVRGTFAYRTLPAAPPGTPSLKETFDAFRKVPIPSDPEHPKK